MHPVDILHRLPPSTTLLFLPALLITADAHALPRQTKIVPYHELDVLPYPVPTAALFPRQQHNTICGYIAGDPDLPATCSAGSHCAVDVEHGAIGCCPDGGACTAGVYTGCVDGNSDPQTEINPYVFTCGGGESCFQNHFDGGYFQYGCGESTVTGQTVLGSASGKGVLSLTKLSVQMTEEPSTLSEPTTLGSGTRTSKETTETGSSTTETESTSTEESSTEQPSASQTEDADEADAQAPDSNNGDSRNIGAIVGGTIGGVAFVAALIVLGLYLWRRRKGNTRHGPGMNHDAKYIRSALCLTSSFLNTNPTSPMEDGRHPFAPLPSVQEVDESQLPQEMPRAAGAAGGANTSGDISSDSYRDEEYFNRSVSPYRSSSSTNGGRAVGGSGLNEQDHMPLTSDLGRGFSREEPMPVPVADEFMRRDLGQTGDGSGQEEYGYGQYPGPRRRDDGGALWQQNRRQTRNMMWM